MQICKKGGENLDLEKCTLHICKKGGEHLENGEVVGLNWGVAGHLKIMIITITNIICVQLKLTEQMPKLNLLAYLP